MDGMMEEISGSSKWLAVTLSPEALITSVSAGTANSLGYSPQELFNRPVTQILADDSAFELPHILDAAGKWGFWEGGLVHQSRTGEAVEARGALSLLANQQNGVAGYLLISRVGRPLSPDQIDHSGFTEISAYLRVIAHELNNPLAVMMGFTQLLTMNATCPAKIRADIDRVYSELKRVIDIVERLHEYAFSLCKKTNQVPLALAGIRESSFGGQPAASSANARSRPKP